MLSLFKILISALVCILSTTILYAEETNSDLVSAHGVFVFNTLLFLIGGFLVMWMAAGFAMLEAGLVRSKNVTTQLTKNIALFSIAAIAYYLVGYNLMYPGDLKEGSWWISGYLGPILSINLAVTVFIEFARAFFRVLVFPYLSPEFLGHHFSILPNFQIIF